jgi:rubrerythrin
MESTNGIGDRPSYINLLNSAALGETRAAIYLSAWANVTLDEDLRKVLEFVARRETAHGEAFRRRLLEMGYDVQDRDDPAFEERLRRLGSPDYTDLAKVRFVEGEPGEIDPFIEIERQISENAFDPLTTAMLRWYITEERDSGAMLRDAYALVKAKVSNALAGRSSSVPVPSMPAASAPWSPDASAVMGHMSQGFGRLEEAIHELTDVMKESMSGYAVRGSGQKVSGF